MDIEREIERLNPMQREAVLHAKGPLLILAGAGSGKTRVITMRAAHLLHKGVLPSSVLAVTFTNKAAREMGGRVRVLLNGNGRSSPLISTFHSLCLNILRREIGHLGYRRDFSIYDTSDQVSLLRNLLSDIRFSDKTFRIESVLERISRGKNALDPAPPADNGKDKIAEVTEELSPKYHEALKTLNAVDFDDLLLLALRLFREHPGVLQRYQERFRYIMVDEYQDTNRVQYEFIKLLSGERKNLCVVGDDDQSIYGWRGANIGNVLDFERDFRGTTVIRLEQNYRSTGHILKAANSVIRNNKKRMEKSLWTAGKPGPKATLFRAADGDHEAKWVADRISMIKFEKGLRYEDFAVIYRANLFSRPFEEALRRLRIPYSVVGGTSYFEHKEIKDLAAYLKIIANPCDDLSLLRIANIPRRGLGVTALGKLSEYAKARSMPLLEAFAQAGEIEGLEAKAAESAADLAVLLERYRGAFTKKRDMGETFRTLAGEICYGEYIKGLYRTAESAMRRLEDMESFLTSLSAYAREYASPSLSGFLENLALTDRMEEKDERKGSGVTLISFHSAKGLEFPVVFICGLEEDILPHRKSADADETIEEERRLFYVGITRAKKELCLTYAAKRTKYGKQLPVSPSRFLDEIPEDVLMRIDGSEAPDPEEEKHYAQKSLAHIKAMLGD